MGARLQLLIVLSAFGAGLSGSLPAAPIGAPALDPACGLRSVAFELNGEPAPLVAARRGDRLSVSFEIPEGCANRVTVASFRAPAPAFDGSRLDDQVVVDRDTRLLGAGRHTLAVDVYAGSPGGHTCGLVVAPEAVSPEAVDRLRSSVRAIMSSAPAYADHVRAAVQDKRTQAKARTSAAGGANQPGPYDSTCDGSPSQNGDGGGGAGGRPCAGCVGNADDKNPPGQQPGGVDPNAGYECDRNHGVGRGNPAHSGCENFQLDVSYGPVTQAPEGTRAHRPGLLAAVFCLGTTSICYLTDHTANDAVLGGRGS